MSIFLAKSNSLSEASVPQKNVEGNILQYSIARYIHTKSLYSCVTFIDIPTHIHTSLHLRERLFTREI